MPTATKPKKLKVGDTVQVVAAITLRDYTAEGHIKRKALVGKTGKIIKESGGHGLCYEVRTPTGESAYFDPDEIKKVRNTKAPAILRRSATVKISTALETDTVKQWTEDAHKDRLAHRGQTGKIVSGGARQGIFGVKTDDGQTSYYHAGELTAIRVRKAQAKKAPAHAIRIQARIDVGLGNHLTLHTSQDWNAGIPMTNVESNLWEAKVPSAEGIEFKVRLNGHTWETGENHKCSAGALVQIEPHF